MVNYNWDVYEWAYNNPGTSIFPYDVNLYRYLLQKSKFVACPSWSVVYRNEEFFGIPRENSVIVKSFARQITIDPATVRDDRFVYMPLRQIPDRNLGWFERACTELSIPYRISDKRLSEEDYADAIASCSFLVCPWYEASTGGLSLIEGMTVGKPVLFSDSKYMGAEDYLGEYAVKFKHDDYGDFKSKISELWEDTPVVALDDSFIDQFKPEVMVSNLLNLFMECL
jgi:glycosyltransferase involved in cell wall biosynthesis